MSTLAEQIAMAEFDTQAARIAIPALWMSREADERLATRIAILASLRSLEAAERDARRWRAVRNPKLNEYGVDVAPFVGVRGPGGISTFTEEFADAAIDSSMEQPK